jgi:hypothetical protein
MAKEVSTSHELFDCYLTWNEHSGGCCGRSHLYDLINPNNFGTLPTGAQKAQFIRQNVIDNHAANRPSGRGICVEVVLAGGQLRQWGRALQAVGFKRVMQFRNENSGNLCTVFLLDTSKMK